MNPSVSVVIPIYNRIDLLKRTLAGLCAQTYAAFDVIVADDGSEEDVVGAVATWEDRLRLSLVRREHDGYGAGQARNLGARAAASDVVIFIDSDCLPDRELIASHLRWHHAIDRVVIGSRHQVDTSAIPIQDLATGAAVLRLMAFGSEHPDPGQLSSADFRRTLHRRTAGLQTGDEAFRSLVSSNFSVGRDRFMNIGGFSEDFHRWGGEDTELGWRLQNEGLEFVADDEAIVYHQGQVDSGPEGWRLESRTLNDGLIRTKIPHRFYRTSLPGVIYEVPKLSIVVTPSSGPRFPDLWSQLLNQSFTDWEVLALDDESIELRVFAEELRADPRFRLVKNELQQAIRATRGEHVVLLHGLAGLDHRLFSRAVKRMDKRTSVNSLRVAYLVPTENGVDVFKRPQDLEVLDQAWGTPLFVMFRRRHLIGRVDSLELSELLASESDQLPGDPLLIMPGHEPTSDLPDSVPPLTSDRSLLMSEIRQRPGRAVVTIPRFLINRMRGKQYRVPARTRIQTSTPNSDQPVQARYIGWSGHTNLGDEALLAAIRALLGWADITTSGPAGHLLILGGGTLINRGYLRQVAEHDSPRVERVVFGTGVANPSYWGTPKEDPDKWIAFLRTCGYVGVRGPTSADLLKGWGYKGRLEIVGDPALALRPPPTPQVAGRVVVSPAFARGELWGASDEVVYAALGDLVKGLTAEGREVFFLSCFPGDDRHIFETMRRAGNADLPYLAGYDSIEAAMGLLASASVVVAERLHAAVLAAASGSPFVALEYRPKLIDFARSVDMEDFVIRTNAVGGEALSALVKKLESDAGVGERMAARVAEYRTRLTTAATEIEGLVRPPGLSEQ